MASSCSRPSEPPKRPTEVRGRRRSQGGEHLGTSAWCTARSRTLFSRSARASPWCTRAHHEVHEGAFRDWGYQVAKGMFRRGRDRRRPVVQDSEGNPARHRGSKTRSPTSRLQQVLTRPKSSTSSRRSTERRLPERRARRAGRRHRHRPGGNINYLSGHAIFEATTAPRPSTPTRQGEPRLRDSLAEMMLRHLKWNEAADLIIKGLDKPSAART